MNAFRLIAALAVLGVVVSLAAGCGIDAYAGLRQAQQERMLQQKTSQSLDGRTRIAKTRLIEQLKAPPQIVIFGGSRAMRFDPAYIHRRTGLTAFNAAVTHARPEDAWALLNLLHARFPNAGFRFLWVIHGDEFIRRPIDAAVLLDPALARFFPPSLVETQTAQAAVRAQGTVTTAQIDLPSRGGLVYAPDGYAVSGFFSNGTPPPGGHPGAVSADIRKELQTYGSSPVALYPRSVRYFVKDLRLMDSLSPAPPAIVAAPFDRRIYTATFFRGWGTRHHRILRLLGRLHASTRFSYLDLSRAVAHGFTPSEFYDGIHLTPQGAERVIDLVLSRFPRAFLVARAP